MFLSLSLSFFLHQLIISCSDFCRKQTSTKSTPSPSLLVFREPCGNEMSGTTNREMDEHQPILVPRVGNATFLADKLRFSLSLCLQTNDRAFFSSVTAVLPPPFSKTYHYYYYYCYFKGIQDGPLSNRSPHHRRGGDRRSWKVAREAKT